MSDYQPTCNERIEEHMQSALDDLAIFDKYGFADPGDIDWHEDEEDEGDRERMDELGAFCDYGLSWDYVEPGTFEGQDEGFYRYQLSYGGPSDEFRFYGGFDGRPHRIEYRFHDWGDGAGRNCYGEDFDLMVRVWDFFEECGMCRDHLDVADRRESQGF